jgi:hypothetical protein
LSIPHLMNGGKHLSGTTKVAYVVWPYGTKRAVF